MSPIRQVSTMSHESIVYGFIEGAGYGGPGHRKYQLLVSGMFSAPEFSQRRGTTCGNACA